MSHSVVNFERSRGFCFFSSSASRGRLRNHPPLLVPFVFGRVKANSAVVRPLRSSCVVARLPAMRWSCRTASAGARAPGARRAAGRSCVAGMDRRIG